jgi:hypothetical protein
MQPKFQSERLPVTATAQGILVTTRNPTSILVNLWAIHNRVTKTAAKGTAARSTIPFPRIIQHQEDWRDTLSSLLQETFEIEQGGFFTAFVDEGSGHPGLPTSTGSAYSVLCGRTDAM